MSLKANLKITLQNRKALKRILDSVTVEQINTIPAGFNNNIIWNCAHIISVQQMLTYGLGNLPFTVDKAMVMEFGPGTKPVKLYDETFIISIKTLLFQTYEQLESDIAEMKFKTLNPFVTLLNFEIADIESGIAFNQYHEALHMGHILNIRRFL